MLYLAEVVQKKGFMGSRSELKLLACQKGEQWSAVSNEDPIAADEANNHKDGALVLVDLLGSGSDRRIQRVQEGTRQIVSMLQSYSRQQEKSKSQEEEIQQWMESLTFQSQELNRREMEMEARREQLEQLEQELQQMDRQRQEIQEARDSAQRLRQEVEHKNKELEQAWAQFRSEEQRLQQERENLEQQGRGIDPQQAQALQALADRLAAGEGEGDLKPALETCLQIADAQQTILQHRWERIDSERNEAAEIQQQVDGEASALAEAWSQWHDRQTQLDGDRGNLAAREAELTVKQQYLDALNAILGDYDGTLEQLQRFAAGESNVSDKVNLEALENMPLGELQETVSQLQQDLEKVSRFVSDQEEELKLQHQTLEELEEKIRNANEYDRLQLETELADERDHYKMLNETLVGQRRNLQDREEVFHLNQAVLRKRQGLSVARPDGSVDLSPLVAAVEERRQETANRQQQLQGELGELEGRIGELRSSLEQRGGELETERGELKDRDRALQDRRTAAAELRGKVAVSEEFLEPMQQQVDGMRQHLEALLSGVGDGDRQEAIAQLQHLLAELAQSAQAA